MMKHNIANRILSALLCLALLITCFPVIPLSAGAESITSVGTNVVTTEDEVFRDGIYYTLKRTTRYLGNRNYSVQLDLSANMSSYDHARVRTASRNGYVTVEQSGYYLLELWGGRGGNGSDGLTGAVLIPLPTPGGSGGAGGYVYGKVYLEAGQTLAYNIGTNGTQSAEYNDGAGGVNGDGGTHGDSGSYRVGAGGGYTAIYLFEKGEFKEEYVTETTFNIPLAARLSRYLMIAGGGGGGGAGMGGGLLTLADNGSPPSSANGGAGGNINRGISMSLLGSDYDVPGYVFSGRSGFSSGSDSTWVGRGGSNVPGAVSETLMGMFNATSLPNDWSGTYYGDGSAEIINTRGGAGGSGNFRGGGGGSGYAGGSGGLMKAQLIAAHVGGGGGGSSFVAETANGKPIEFLNLTADEMQYLSGASQQPVGSGTGGAVQITYLSGETDDFHYVALENIKLQGTVSKYFDISANSVTTGNVPIATSANADGGTDFVAEGLTVVPQSPNPNRPEKTASVTLYIKAKDEFMGGNSVPLISDVRADFLSPNDNTTPLTVEPSDNKAHTLVNVPLNAKVRTNSYTSSTDGKAYAVTSLYVNDYGAIRDSLRDSWKYDYIGSITDYSVYKYDKPSNQWELVQGNTVAPKETTTYEVRIEVSPLYAADPEVVIGPPVERLVTGTSVISVVLPGTSELNGLRVTGSKNLSYADGTYTFTTIVDQQSGNVTIGGETTVYGINDNPEFVAPEDGWYYVEAWGGKGGSTGYAEGYYNYKTIWGTSTSGYDGAGSAVGGDGGYVTKYVYLLKDEKITFTIGRKGADGEDSFHAVYGYTEWIRSTAEGGYGGTPTTVYVGDDTLLIAGGGGGAGGAAFTAKTKSMSKGLESISRASGATGKKPDSYTSDLSANFTGSKGNYGYISSNDAYSGTAGSGGYNYSNSNYGTTQDGRMLSTAAQKYAKNSIKTTKSGTNGQVAVTMIENSDMEAVMETVKGLETKVAFSKYFDVASVELDVGTYYTSKKTVENGDGSMTVTYTNSSYGQIAQFTYLIETLADKTKVITITDCDYSLDGVYTKVSSGYSLYYTAHLEFAYGLKPREGFLGGNDVPVLVHGLTGNQPDTHDGYGDYGVKISQGSEFMNLLPANPTDYANVAYTVDMTPYLTVQDKTIMQGESVEKSELYTFTPPAVTGGWEDDYASFAAPSNETYSNIMQTTTYPITVGFAPRIPEAEKATIVGSQSAQEYTMTATVYVEVPVSTSLTNLVYEGESKTLWGEPFACVLKPVTGYLLPDTVTVTIGGVETSNFSYNSSLGTLQIEGEYVTGPIVISGAADIITYDIHFVYTEYDPVTGNVTANEAVYADIPADEVIDWSGVDGIVANIPSRDGYEYRLQYDTADSKRPATMPANNLWVYGDYAKKEYLLSIEYLYADGTQAAEPYNSYVVFGDAYSVTSPTATKGYLPDQAVVQGVMGTADTHITVTYNPSMNKLVILYQKPDGSLLGSKEYTMATDEEYSLTVDQFEGYTAQTPVVTGKMQGDASETVVVLFTPNQYTVTFDKNGFDGATLDSEATKLVEYDKTYGYNATTKIYDGLPTAQIAGYTFVGWYTEPECITQVKETDSIKLSGDITLYAKWERTKFRLTVQYQFLYEDGDYIPEGFDSVDAVRTFLVTYTDMVEFGAPYSVTLPSFVGYTAYRNFDLADEEALTVLSGTMPGQNRLVVITYEINSYTIRFKDLPGEHVTYSDEATSNVASDSFDTQWKEVVLKHDVVPVYVDEDDTPVHATTANYTYQFTGWYGSADNVVYPGKVNSFPNATQSCDYYAMYTATENTVSVTHGSVGPVYFTTVQNAMAYAQENMVSGLEIDLRRNDGNGTELNLNGNTLEFGDYGETTYSVTVDLNGLQLKNTEGKPIIDNSTSPVNLTIKSTGAAGGISVEGDDAVVAIQNTTGSLTTSNQINIQAKSNNGDATAIRFSSPSTSYNLSLSATSTVEATAANGTACGIDMLSSASVTAAAVKAEGKTAIGINANDGTTITLPSSTLALTVSATETATGIRIPEGATLVNTVANSTKHAITSDADAYGIYNAGTVTSLAQKMNVTAAGKAYGLYNNAGTVTVTGIQVSTDLRATGTEGYGIFNESNGTAIGAEDGAKLKTGAFAGSSFGIYSADDSIYASGNEVYFKGADENSALSGVVHTDYYQTESAKPESGYYRLAAKRTITFVTNEGTPIATVETLYGKELDPVVTTRSGYTFVSWHRTEDLSSKYTYPATMPDEDLILYAEWSLNNYQYALDLYFKPVKVKFYQTDPTDPTNTEKMTLIYEQDLTLDSNVLNAPGDLSYASGSVLYVHSGWYTSPTISRDNRITLNGDIGQYADENGELILYSGWHDFTNMQGHAQIGTSASGVFVDASYSSYSYLYYVVPADGNYTIYYRNSGSSSTTGRRRYITIDRYYYSNGTEYFTTPKPRGYVSVNTSTYSSAALNSMYAGDVVVLRAERYSSRYTGSSYDTTVYAYITSSTVDLNAVKNYEACSEIVITPIDYNVTMGTVNLPVREREDMKFKGWAETENAPEADHFMQITPDMVDTVEEWQNGELWLLHSQWAERIWTSYQSSDRDFTDFESTSDVTIRDDETVSFRFKAKEPPTDVVTFQFENGLPAGTIVTLIDQSGEVPVYYTYTATGKVTELYSTEFVKMGDPSVYYTGMGTDLVLQICYQNATVTNTKETVQLYAGDTVFEADAEYNIILSSENATTLTDASFSYLAENQLEVTVPSLNGQGLPGDHKVFLRVRWDGLNLAPGTKITVDGQPAAVYDGEYAFFDLGLTVADCTAAQTKSVKVYLPTMVQNEFGSKTFHFEVCVAPNTEAAFGYLVRTVSTATQTVTLTETPSLSVDEVLKNVAAGEELTVSVSDADADIYLLRQSNDGKFYYAAECATVFSDVTVDENGLLSSADGELITDGKFTATVSVDAMAGKYYLVIQKGDKYERVLIKVTPAVTSE